MLSKSVLRGEDLPDTAQVHEPDFYRSNGIELVTGRTVRSIDRDADRAHLDDGETIAFTSAVLATGAEPRMLVVPGAGLDGIHLLRTIDDARRLSSAIAGAERVAVVGAGWIGSEVAASAREMGAQVVLVDPATAPLQHMLGTDLANLFRDLHTERGVDLRLSSGVIELRGTERVEAVVLDDGRVEAADVVVVGIGVTPRVKVAARAGLDVANGIVVDENLQTTRPNVFAAGDVASAWHPHYGRHLRIEHWSNAIHQGTTAGTNATTSGPLASYDRLPYFFSDQYDVGLEYVGLAERNDEIVVRGSIDDRMLTAFWHHRGVVNAAMNLNVWEGLDDLRSIVTNRRQLDLGLLADATVPLKRFT